MMTLLELIEAYANQRHTGSHRESEKYLEQIKTALNTVGVLCNEAQSYVDIGWDHSDESTDLITAIKTVRRLM